jgi:hypothetical protein
MIAGIGEKTRGASKIPWGKEFGDNGGFRRRWVYGGGEKLTRWKWMKVS